MYSIRYNIIDNISQNSQAIYVRERKMVFLQEEGQGITYRRIPPQPRIEQGSQTQRRSNKMLENVLMGGFALLMDIERRRREILVIYKIYSIQYTCFLYIIIVISLKFDNILCKKIFFSITKMCFACFRAIVLLKFCLKKLFTVCRKVTFVI